MQLAALLRLLAVACAANLATVAEDGADAGTRPPRTSICTEPSLFD